MNSSAEILLIEFEQESRQTKRLLERIPGDKLDWKPHDKSMSLGQLALHIANTPAEVVGMLTGDSFDFKDADFNPKSPSSTEEIIEFLERSEATARKTINSWDEEFLSSPWNLLKDGTPIFSMPRISVIRTIMLNHCYHHRGQLTVYLRLLDIPVPAIYGRSADEDPFC